MADYYPLIARAMDGLAEPGHAARETVYERARAALHAQLRSIAPPLAESEIDRERASLEEAISRIERIYSAERHSSEDNLPASMASEPSAGNEAAEGGIGDDRGSASQKSPIIRSGGRRGRSALVSAGLFAVIAPLAVAAWLWRDQPQAPAPEPPRPAAPPQPASNDPKFSERMTGQGGGAPAPDRSQPSGRQLPEGPRPAGVPPTPMEAPAAPPTTPRPPDLAGAPPAPATAGQPDVAVAQRAALIEENTADPQQPKMTAGRVLWRLDAVNSGQGQLLETVVRASIEIPDSRMSLSLLMRRNRDGALPASHTLELTFTTATSGDDARTVRDVAPPLLRVDETARGVPLSALSVPVKENVFLIGLSSLQSDIDRNTEFLVNRNWLDLPLRFASGARATLVFEKGLSGDRIIAGAFKQWAQP